MVNSSMRPRTTSIRVQVRDAGGNMRRGWRWRRNFSTAVRRVFAPVVTVAALFSRTGSWVMLLTSAVFVAPPFDPGGSFTVNRLGP